MLAESPISFGKSAVVLINVDVPAGPIGLIVLDPSPDGSIRPPLDVLFCEIQVEVCLLNHIYRCSSSGS